MVFMLAACDPGPSGGGIAEELAAQLADDINAIQAGCAVVSGATVTLTAKLETNTLTVPAGVTLDVTASGAEIALNDNATLTVNGTVNAGSKRIRLRTATAEGTIKGSGTIQLTGTGCLLEVRGNVTTTTQTLILDGVTLVGVANNTDPVVRVDGNTMDGCHGIFVMKSGAITGNTDNGDSWAEGGVVVSNGGTFTMEGGAIHGNTANGVVGSEGGGVKVNGGSFTMSGGTIHGNTVHTAIQATQGGGVFINNGSFTMSGGTIYNNISQDTGGGVAIDDNSTFTMSGGAIYSNTAQDRGGGVIIHCDDSNFNSTFTMSGGTIYNNTAEIGGGVHVYRSSIFTMDDGAIYGNTAQNGGGVEVYGNNSKLIMNGGRIQGNSDSDGFTKNTGNNGAALKLGNTSTATFGPAGGKVGSTTKNSNDPIIVLGSGTTDETIIAPATQ